MTTHPDFKSELDSMAIAAGGIWASVLAISLLSPDMVSGSEQQHLPIAAFTTWIWGTVASFGLFTFWRGLRLAPGRPALHRPVAVSVAVVWAVAAAVSIFGPELVTGSDPTRVPLCAFIAPIAATLATAAIRVAAKVAGSGLYPHHYPAASPWDAPTSRPVV